MDARSIMVWLRVNDVKVSESIQLVEIAKLNLIDLSVIKCFD